MGKIEVLPPPPAHADGGDHHPYQRPRTAATLILLDHAKPATRVLMGRRHAGHAFIPGKFVFPGGRVEPTDRLMPSVGALDPVMEAKLCAKVVRPTPGRARALALAAIRETYEETGLALGTKAALAPRRAPSDVWARFAAHGVLPDLSAMRFIFRAITPPGRPRRYDTHFFCLEASAIAHRVEGIVTPDSELVELVWVPLAEARGLELPLITHSVLAALDTRIAAGLGHDLPVPFMHHRNRRWLREEL
jgi:8-oxo-dGTP pyrophosphatase MutT (NUDIX family)